MVFFNRLVGCCAILIASGIASSTAYAQPNYLKQQLEKAKSFDPIYLAAVASLDVAQKATLAAESLRGPRVSFSASMFRNERIESSTTFRGESFDVSRQFESQNVGIQARQPLYRKREALGIDQALAQQNAASQMVLYAQQDLQARLLSAWIEVLSSRTFLAAYLQTLHATREVLTEVSRRRQSGEAVSQEVEQARARVAVTEGLVEEARTKLLTANQVLSLIVGPDAELPAGMNMAFFRSLPAAIGSEKELHERIEQSNFELMSARFQEESARIEARRARSDKTPIVDLVASATKGQNSSLSFLKDERRLGLELSLPLYTHGAIDATIAQAEANLRKSQAQTRSTEFRVRQEALSAFYALDSLRSRISAADQMSGAALLSLQALRGGYRAGVNSRGEVALQLAEVVSTQRERVLLRKEYASAWVKLQIAIGGLDAAAIEAFQVAVTREPPL